MRRSSDDTEQDIGFDSNGDLDTAALLAFVGTGGTDNGFVTTFYDQSGNGNDATNINDSEQPLVVSGGTLVTENGKAAVEFSGNPVYLDASSAISDAFTGNSVYQKFEVAQVTSTSKGGILSANIRGTEVSLTLPHTTTPTSTTPMGWSLLTRSM